MAVSNYLGTKSEREAVEKARHRECRHIEAIPAGEREEIPRQSFARKGFSGDLLEHSVEVITSNSKLWVDTMLTEELGLQLDGPHPLRAALATLFSFVIVGLIPLAPFLLPNFDPAHRLVASAIVTAAAFFAVGAIKGVAGQALGALRSGNVADRRRSCSSCLSHGHLVRHAYGVS